MQETIQQSYDCIVCNEHWTTEHFVDDYEDDELITDNICCMCYGSISEAVKNKIEYEKYSVYEVVYYVIKRLFNKFLLSVRLP